MAENDLADVLLGFTNYVMNERVRCYNEGVDAGTTAERERCAKVADNEIIDGAEDGANQVARVIGTYIRSGGTPSG